MRGAPSGRVDLLRELTARQPWFGLAVTAGGLFMEMAREHRGLRPAVGQSGTGGGGEVGVDPERAYR